MYGGQPYAGGPYAGDTMLASAIPVDTEPKLSVEVSFTTNAFATPVWVDVSKDVRSWDVTRGRTRELERFQPGRCTVVLDNHSRDYDSQHATGPWFGNLRPMRRIRIRETFSGVTYPRFDGYVDSWNLDYPGVGTDAIAAVTATDGFKPLAKTELGVSVYANEVDDLAPRVWWRLDDPEFATSVLDHSGNGRTGTKVGAVKFGGQSITVNDPGSSMETTDFTAIGGGMSVYMGVESATAAGLSAVTGWSLEMVFRYLTDVNGARALFEQGTAVGTNRIAMLIDGAAGDEIQFAIINSAGTSFILNSTTPLVVGASHHLVCTSSSSGMKIYIDGVDRTDGAATATGALTQSALKLAHNVATTSVPPGGIFQHFAVYDTVLSQAQITAHYAAMSAPWQGDLPGVRAGRVLDEASWPASLRELDAGETTFQSAQLGSTTVLEHLQKTAETEVGALFMNRAGFARLISRDALAARVSQATFGDGAGEIGYRSVTFLDGDATIKNRATISRLNGVARTVSDSASVSEFGNQDFVLEGLLHDTEAHSTNYAQWVVDNYKSSTRRVVSMELGPAAAGNEATLYPQILGRELGDKITVKARHTDGTGAVFSQDAVIESISDEWTPDGFRRARWTLSPAPGTF